MLRHSFFAAIVAFGLSAAGAASANDAEEYVGDRFAEAMFRVDADAVIEGATARRNSGAPFIVANSGNAVVLIVACEDRCTSVGARLRVAGMPELRVRSTDRAPHLVVMEVPTAYTRTLSNFELNLEIGCRREAGCLHRWALMSRGPALSLAQLGLRAQPTPAELAQASEAASVHWTQRPGANDLRFYYPARAWRSNIAGSARLDCLIAAGGALRCRASGEQPGSQGFGDAALKLSTVLRVAERNEAGEPLVGQRVTVPIQFQPGA